MANHGKKIGDIIENNLRPLTSDILLTLKAREIYKKLPNFYPVSDSRVAVVREKILFIRVDNTSAATKLRYVKNNLLEIFRQNGILINDVKILSHPLQIPIK